MKNLLLVNLVFITCFCIPNFTFGQLSGFGVGGGGAFSNFEYGEQVNSVDDFDNNTKTGGTGGLRFDFDLGNEFLKMSPEIFIIQNGAKEYYRDFDIFQDDLINRRLSLDYIGLYLPLTFYIPLGDASEEVYNGIFLQGRGFLDYAINGHLEDNIPGSGMSEIKFSKESDKFDYGYSFEGGFVVNGLKLMFGYNWGIKNIEFSSAVGDVSSENYLMNNKGFTLQIGYLYKIDSGN